MLLGCLITFVIPVFAQEKTGGKIISAADGQILPGATLSINGRSVAADSSGNFNATVSGFPVEISVSAIGYQKLKRKINKPSGRLILSLQPVDQMLNQVVVTAGRSRQRIKDVPQKTELISAKDIASTPSLDVTDILKKTAAVNVIQYPGLLSGVGFRGFRPQFSGITQRTLLLINGRPAGTTNLGTIDLNNIDHIEVLKGPASALYGSQAMGGVVNIITPQTTGRVRGNLFADYGSFETYQFGGKAGGNITEKLDFDLSGTYFDRNRNFQIGDGNLFRKALGSGTALNTYSNGTDSVVKDTRADGQRRPNTQYSYYTSSLRLGYRFNPDWRVDVNGTLFRADDVESPGDIFSGEAGAGLKDVSRDNGEAALSGKIKNHELIAKVYYASERSTSFAVRTTSGVVIADPFLSAKNDYRWFGSQLRDAISFGKHKIIAGYDYTNTSSRLRQFSTPQNGQQNQTASSPNAAIISHGLYTQGQFLFFGDKLKVNPGLRLDLTGFSLYGTPGYTRTLITGTQDNHFLSPSLSTQYNFLPELALHGSIGRAFVTPDANQVAGYAVAGKGSGRVQISEGNAELKNESSFSEEIGLKFDRPQSGFAADFTYFSTNVKDRIVARSAQPPAGTLLDGERVTSVTNYFNANKSRIRGLEIMASYDFGALVDYRYSLRVFTNITGSIRADDITVAANGTENKAAIQNVAWANVNTGLEYSHNAFSTRLNGRYTGKRWDTDFNNALRPLVQYPSFLVLDASVSYTYQAHHQLSFSLSNITDENYYEKRGYNMPGRAFRLRYTYNWGLASKNSKS